MTRNLFATHNQRIQNADNFTRHATREDITGDGPYEYNFTHQVALEEGEVVVDGEKQLLGDADFRGYAPNRRTVGVRDVLNDGSLTEEWAYPYRVVYPHEAYPRAEEMYALAQHVDLTAQTTRTFDGETVIVYSGVANRSLPKLSGELTGVDRLNLSQLVIEMYVTEDGVIKQFEYAAGFANVAGETIYQQKGVTTFRDINETTVSEPNWYESAEARSSSFETQLRNGQIEATLRGNNTIPAGAEITFAVESIQKTVTIDQAIEPGERIYIAVTDEELNPRLSVGSPVTGDLFVIQTLSVEIRVSIDDKVVLVTDQIN
ncbi:hypothetical protein RYH80_18390 [Halobaculum sp. MBLA0147]|uniref:DUF7537 family lipoprotein n=1 Tax=Halobaculum sp. MBLA0147 TaxID=3079934 RepID=UPI0035233C3A